MNINTDAPGGRLHGRLGTSSILLMVLAAAAPLSVWMSTGTTMAITNGGALPFNFVVAGSILLLFAVGFTAMTRHVKDAGAFYAFVGSGLGRRMGVGTAFLALLTYICILTGCYAYFGVVAQSLLVSNGLPDIPWWVLALALNLLITGLGYLNVDFSTKVLGVVLSVEVAVIVVLSVVILAQGSSTPEGISFAGFQPDLITSGSLGLGVMFAFGGFTGFESTAVYRDEARDPSRTIPRATYLAVIFIALLYVFSIFALTIAWGPKAIQSVAIERLATADLVQATGEKYIGDWYADALAFFIATSLFACLLAFHNVVARYLHSLGRKELLPSKLAEAHPQHGSPHIASHVTGVVTVALTVLWVALGWKPIEQVVVHTIGIGTLGITLLFALTSLAVLVFFQRFKVDTRPWNSVIAPALSFVALCVILYLAMSNVDVLSGTSNGLINGIMAGAPFLAVALGAGIAVVISRSRPRVYEALDFSARDSVGDGDTVDATV